MTDISVRPEPGRWPHRLGRALPVVLALFGLSFVAGPWEAAHTPLLFAAITGSDKSVDASWWSAQAIAGYVQVAVLGVVVVAERRHGMRPCHLCAGRFPLDPEGQASKRRWHLRTAHLLHDVQGRDRLPTVIWLAWVLCAPQGWPQTVFVGAFFLFLAVDNMTLATHAGLQPWCPWCRGGGNGDDDPAPAPVPGGGLLLDT